MTTETKTEARERMDNEEFELRAKATVSQLIPPVAWLVEEASRARASEASLTAEVERLLKLAYLGDHYFPDLTWKARCEETVGDLRKEQAALSALRAEHQRTQADLEDLRSRHAAAAPAIERLVADRDELRSQLAEVTKERDEALAANEGLLDDAGEKMLHRTIRELRAALAASEEKAREASSVIAQIWEHITKACEHPDDGVECLEWIAKTIKAAKLAPASPATGAAPCGDDMKARRYMESIRAKASPAPRVGAESEANEKCGIRISGDEWCALPHPHEGPHRAKRPAPASEEPKR